MLEKQIEKKVCDYAKEKGLLVYKFASPARAAVPDRMFITPKGKVFFIEFKRFGQISTEAQNREHARLHGHNVLVLVCDNVLFGTTAINTVLKSE